MKAPMLVALVFGLVFAPGAMATKPTLTIEPGQWRFSTNTFLSSAPTLRPAKVAERCVTDPELTPEAFSASMEGCDLVSAQSSGDSMVWEMECFGESSEAHGSASFTSTGTTLAGTMNMTLTGNGGTIEMKIIWDAERLGDCD